jgi:hypothetical protein
MMFYLSIIHNISRCCLVSCLCVFPYPSLKQKIKKTNKGSCDFRLLPRCKWDLLSFGIVGSFVLKFWDNLSVPSLSVKQLKSSLTLKMGPIHCPKTSIRNYHFKQHAIRKECRSQIFLWLFLIWQLSVASPCQLMYCTNKAHSADHPNMKHISCRKCPSCDITVEGCKFTISWVWETQSCLVYTCLLSLALC